LIAFAFEQCIISDDKSPELEGNAGDVGQTEWAASTLTQISDHDVLLLPGDLSYSDWNQPLWDSWGRLVQPLASARPWMVTAGNHERKWSREPSGLRRPRTFVPYNARWRMPHEASGSVSSLYYSFDAARGAVHVVMLASYADFGAGSEQHMWLRRDLAAVDRRRTPWVVALMHVPCYNTNRAHQGEGEDMRRDMERLPYEARVDVVFACHTHAYERFVSAGHSLLLFCFLLHVQSCSIPDESIIQSSFQYVTLLWFFNAD
jgi:acid phosphatase type 7